MRLLAVIALTAAAATAPVPSARYAGNRGEEGMSIQHFSLQVSANGRRIVYFYAEPGKCGGRNVEEAAIPVRPGGSFRRGALRGRFSKHGFRVAGTLRGCPFAGWVFAAPKRIRDEGRYAGLTGQGTPINAQLTKKNLEQINTSVRMKCADGSTQVYEVDAMAGRRIGRTFNGRRTTQDSGERLTVKGSLERLAVYGSVTAVRGDCSGKTGFSLRPDGPRR
jgi:hypothetical protein